MVSDGTEWASIGGRITHGTATPVLVRSVVPASKAEKETFWVRAVASMLPEFAGLAPQIISSPNDANGGPDVLIAAAGREIGVQVTELTLERGRMRRAQQPKYVERVLQEIKARAITSERKLVVVCFTQDTGEKTYSLPRPEIIAASIERWLSEIPASPRMVPLVNAQLLFTWADDGDFYVPHAGNIGFDTNTAELSRSPSGYRKLVEEIARKKREALAPWLVIWSLTFWRDRDFCEAALVECMRARFRDLPFERVFFVHSMDGEGFFENNLHLHRIVPGDDALSSDSSGSGH